MIKNYKDLNIRNNLPTLITNTYPTIEIIPHYI